MASPQGNEDALVAFARRITSRLGLDLGSGLEAANLANVSDVDRVWIPDQQGLQLGARLGCLRNLPRSPDSAARVDCGLAFSLMLDPRWTAPNARIGVSFKAQSSASTYRVLAPGEVVSIPSGFRDFYVYNADRLDIYGGGPVARDTPLGFVAFLVGRSVGASFGLQAHASPEIPASILWVGDMLNGPAGPIIPTYGLTALRVHAQGLTAGGANTNTWVAALFANVFSPFNVGAPLNLPSTGFTPDGGTLTGLSPEYAADILSGQPSGQGVTGAWVDLPVNSDANLLRLFASVMTYGAGVATQLPLIIEGITARNRTPVRHRRRRILYDNTSAVAGTLNPILERLDQLEAVQVTAFTTAAGVPTAYTLAEVTEAGTAFVIPGTSAPAATIVDAVGPGCNVARRVPSRLQPTVTAPAGQTTRLIVEGFGP